VGKHKWLYNWYEYRLCLLDIFLFKGDINITINLHNTIFSQG